MRILTYLRKKKGWTQEEVAKKMNTARNTISDYETGRTQPDIQTLSKFAQLYGVTMDDLVNLNWDNGENSEDKYFAFALYDEAKDLTPEQKEDLLEMIKIMKKRNEKEK